MWIAKREREREREREIEIEKAHRSFIHSFTHLFIHLLIHSFIHNSFIHSFHTFIHHFHHTHIIWCQNERFWIFLFCFWSPYTFFHIHTYPHTSYSIDRYLDMSDRNGWSVVHSRRKGKLFTEHQSHNNSTHTFIHHFHHTHTSYDAKMSVFGSFCFVSDHPIHSFIYIYVSTHII